MSDTDTSYLDPYRRAVDAFGPSFEATLWGSEEAQVLRFDVMTGFVDFGDMRILDIGCARGDLAAHLIDRDIPFRSYIGIDGVAKMIEAAAKRGLDRCEFVVGDVLADADLIEKYPVDAICISGTLNTMEESVARDLVERCFRHAKVAVVFNFLSDRCHPKWRSQPLGPARRFRTIQWLDMAIRLTPHVAFRQDYLAGHDATILLEHDVPGEAVGWK